MSSGRAKRAAVRVERNRIANELHDTISQTLWSVILITERLPAIWEINQEQGRQSLITVQDLARNALEEMRALLLELRPSALTDERLGDLIRQVSLIIAKRAGLQVSIRIEGQEPVPLSGRCVNKILIVFSDADRFFNTFIIK